jgi:hypothetical protein
VSEEASVARMSDRLVATFGNGHPACRFAHAGYLAALTDFVSVAPCLSRDRVGV